MTNMSEDVIAVHLQNINDRLTGQHEALQECRKEIKQGRAEVAASALKMESRVAKLEVKASLLGALTGAAAGFLAALKGVPR